jgi:hypothetical protein
MEGMGEGQKRVDDSAGTGDLKRGGHRWAVEATVILAVVGGLLAVALGRVYRQRQAVARVTALGGSVVYDYQYRREHLDLSAAPPGPEFLRKWLGDDAFANVEYVHFAGSSVPACPTLTDADLDVLSSFPRLTTLQVAAPTVGDHGLEYIGRLRSLETLSLAWGNFSDSGLEHLKELTHLRKIWLRGNEITDRGLDHLAGNKGLCWLTLMDTQVTAAGIARQPFARTLESLSFLGASVHDTTLRGLDALTGLKAFGLVDAGVTDAGLAPLARLTRLRSILLGRCPGLTRAGAAALKRSIPACVIQYAERGKALETIP